MRPDHVELYKTLEDWRLAPVNAGAARADGTLRVCSWNDLHGGFALGALDGDWRDRAGEVVRGEVARGGPSLLVSCGDDHAGTFWDAFMDRADLADPAWRRALALGVALQTLGNHDFDWGAERVAGKLRAGAPATLLTNVREGSALVPLVARAGVCRWRTDGGEVACLVLGVCTRSQNRAAHCLEDPLSAILPWLEEVPPELPVVLLGHLGLAAEMELGAALIRGVPGLRGRLLVLGGHTHERLAEADGDGFAYLQSGQQGAGLGISEWRDGRWSVRVEEVDATGAVTECAPFGWVQPFAGGLREMAKDARCLYPPPTTPDARYLGYCPQMAWLCDALRELARTLFEPGVPILGGLCARTLGRVASGPVDRRALYDWLPYPDALAVVELPVSALRALLRRNAQRLLLPPAYHPEEGMLHFDATLRQTIRLGSNAISALDYSLATDAPHVLWVTSEYCASGSGGFNRWFDEAGLSDLPRKRHHPANRPLRELLFEFGEGSAFRNDPGRFEVIWST